ncbi:hypothetical protein LTR94_031392, partial [Friedmanniomyces endolithicus]
PGGQLWLRVLRVLRDGLEAVEISVRDTGIGLAPEVREQVFELFFQGKRSIDRAEGGLGIGLALVKNIVELHGGSVHAHSEGRGLGSEFVVRLPLSSVAQAPAPMAGVASQRVLLVDDNADGADTLGRLLRAHGHAVEVYHDPVGALAALERFVADEIRGQDGVERTETILAITSAKETSILPVAEATE